MVTTVPQSDSPGRITRPATDTSTPRTGAGATGATGAVVRRPRQRDVADLAGVSRTTVSLVLNDVEGVAIPEETRQRVWDAAARLGFQPDAVARSLRGGHSNIVGLVTSEIATTPYAVAIIKGAQDAAFERGQTLLVIDTEGEQAAAVDAVARLRQWRADGLILATDYHRQVELPPGLGDLPVVLVDCFVEAPPAPTTVDPDAGADVPRRPLPTVLPDEVQGGRLATQTLLDAGHRRIGFINGPDTFPASAGRLEGYRAALEAAGVDFDEQLVRPGDWWQESASRAATELLRLEDPPTAIFCGNDWMAMGAYDALRELGLAIPGDVSVIGFDNRVEIADHMRPRLSTVALPYRAMGHEAVRMLLDGEPRSEPVLLECPLVSRDSVGPPPHGRGTTRRLVP
jgi:LacI family transcriptional regulator